jgi:hypothetical protein
MHFVILHVVKALDNSVDGRGWSYPANKKLRKVPVVVKGMG